MYTGYKKGWSTSILLSSFVYSLLFCHFSQIDFHTVTTEKHNFIFASTALTMKQLLVKVAQHIHEVFTGFLWQDLPCEGSLIFITAKVEMHNWPPGTPKGRTKIQTALTHLTVNAKNHKIPPITNFLLKSIGAYENKLFHPILIGGTEHKVYTCEGTPPPIPN